MRLTLTHFELRVLLVNYEQTALATYDFAVCRSLLQRCSSLHIFFLLFVSKYDATFGEVVWTHLNFYFIAWKNLDVVHTHLSRDMTSDFVSIF
mgnify:CR=1 FL=1